MARLFGIELPTRDYLNTEGARAKLMMIQAVRVSFYAIIFAITIYIQFRQKDFFNIEVLFPLYLTIASSFFISSLYLFYFKVITQKYSQVTAALFVFDALLITALIYFTEVNQSIFLFMYLVNIIFCGLVYQRSGGYMLSLLTSVCFSFLTVIGPDIETPSLIFSVVINNLAFFAVAALSGYLSEQLNFMGGEIQLRERDITILKNLNELIIENVATGLMTLDLNGRVVHVNKAAYHILGYQPKVGQPLSEFFGALHKEIQEHHRIVGEKGLSRFEVQYLNQKEERQLLGCSVSLLKTPTGEASGYIVIFQDLTEIKRLEKAVQRSEKLAAVGQLAAGIAHEIRNPLASISGSIQLLKSSWNGKTSDDEKLMAITLKEIDRLNHLINDFLDFVRPESAIEKDVDINSLLKEVLDMVKLNSQLRSEVVQVVDLKANRKIIGNHEKLKQVFLNFVINAYQAMQKTENPSLRVTSEVESGVLRVRVQDNGSGMSEKTLKRLFEPFYTTKPQGTGLGLATVHKILEHHEAHVFVESHEGKGTEFVVEFTKLAPVANLKDTTESRKVRGNG